MEKLPLSAPTILGSPWSPFEYGFARGQYGLRGDIIDPRGTTTINVETIPTPGPPAKQRLGVIDVSSTLRLVGNLPDEYTNYLEAGLVRAQLMSRAGKESGLDAYDTRARDIATIADTISTIEDLNKRVWSFPLDQATQQRFYDMAAHCADQIKDPLARASVFVIGSGRQDTRNDGPPPKLFNTLSRALATLSSVRKYAIFALGEPTIGVEHVFYSALTAEFLINAGVSPGKLHEATHISRGLELIVFAAALPWFRQLAKLDPGKTYGVKTWRTMDTDVIGLKQLHSWTVEAVLDPARKLELLHDVGQAVDRLTDYKKHLVRRQAKGPIK